MIVTVIEGDKYLRLTERELSTVRHLLRKGADNDWHPLPNIRLTEIESIVAWCVQDDT